MERSGRRDDRRPHRDDNRNHRPKYDTDKRKEQDRSRSPRNDRRDDRRRERSPQRGPPSRGGPPSRDNRGRDHQRDRDSNRGGPPPRRPGDRMDAKPNGAGPKAQQSGKGRQEADTKMQDVPEDEDSEAEMNRIMGFKDFRTTKNTKVPGNDKNFAIYKVKKAEYRQYMNRTGGFNRPLSPSRV
ncbi:hypothetical protein PRZ48_004159 [Zasmidium cellare]|uniref:U4/U6.U5 small nuclear ribonucleoprotein 27kDa protein domain-containing protein n=1 Tax=Zasmidium cellare TaxID=395010 RepID=A0ABR0EX28_ZASCE|nr:hypothetical protein PRZ48_004159 [Zasmidium cellare]